MRVSRPRVFLAQICRSNRFAGPYITSTKTNNFLKIRLFWKTNMNCKLKLHSKGFLYYQILGAVTVLKFLQTLALDFPYICRQLEKQYGKL